MALIFGNAVAIDGGELSLEYRIDGGEVMLDYRIDGGEVGIVYRDSGETHGFYPGPYIVVPNVYDQTLSTRDLIMTDDVHVLEVPYAETSNQYGTTVTIIS